MAVIEALSELEDPAAVPVLLRALTDENAEVRMHALDGLGSFHDELQSGPFIPLLKDANPEVRARGNRTPG
jgi:HEAT repeat protein